MRIVSVDDLEQFTAGDRTLIREVLHPRTGTGSPAYSLAYATLSPGQSSLPHRLRSTEVYYLLHGTGAMHIDDEVEQVRADQAVYIPAGSVQYIENTGLGHLVFLCIVDPPWRQEDEEIC